MSTRHRLCQSDDGGEGRGGDSWGPFTQPMPDTIQNQLDRYRGVLRDTFIHFPVKEAEQQDPCQRPRSMPDPSVADSTTRAVHTWFFKQQPVAIESCNHHQTVVDSSDQIPVVEAPACPPAASECPMTRESFAMSTVSTVESEKSSTKTSGNIVRGASKREGRIGGPPHLLERTSKIGLPLAAVAARARDRTQMLGQYFENCITVFVTRGGTVASPVHVALFP
ncbi:hypothetical protein FOZ62_028486 [Perkinsus olseni]|uniref:Uncharacterized protein n=1 Tax=Perkinsus olseni TaxID=32597 RepID=A0A7J6QCC7_PEROL|nr:hypothetical protein FOZ62_028486 [Perkinsus olseni]